MDVLNRAIALCSLLFDPGVNLHTVNSLSVNIGQSFSLFLSLSYRKVKLYKVKNPMHCFILFIPLSLVLSVSSQIDREEFWTNGQRLNGGSLYGTPLQPNSNDDRW